MGAAKELEPLDDDLRECVEQNMGLVYRIALPMSRSRLSKDDRVQAGTLGLIRAVRKYDPEKSRLSTYADVWIRQAIHLAEMDRDIIHVPVYVRHNHADADVERKAAKHRADAERARSACGFREELTVRDAPEPEADRRDMLAFVRRCVDALPGPERASVLARYWDGVTQEQLADERGVTRQAVQQCYEAGVQRLRMMLAPELAKGA